MVFYDFSNRQLCPQSGFQVGPVGLKLAQVGVKLASSWPQVGLKLAQDGLMLTPNGVQNRSKIEFEAILKVMFLDIFSGIGF